MFGGAEGSDVDVNGTIWCTCGSGGRERRSGFDRNNVR